MVGSMGKSKKILLSSSVLKTVRVVHNHEAWRRRGRSQIMVFSGEIFCKPHLSLGLNIFPLEEIYLSLA